MIAICLPLPLVFVDPTLDVYQKARLGPAINTAAATSRSVHSDHALGPAPPPLHSPPLQADARAPASAWRLGR